MIIPSLAGWIAGEKVTAAKLTTHTKTAIEAAVYSKPFCHLYNSAVQNIASQATPFIRATFNTVVDDSDGMADLPNNRMVVATAGRYRINAQVTFAANTTGFRLGVITAGTGGTPPQRASEVGPPVAVTPTRFQIAWTGRLAVGDIIYLEVAQTSGGLLATDTTLGGVFLQAEWISL